ncbi:hypothetical protein ACFPT7_10940 [Acidicapsa dinghuensis]|uniref:Uncharacterized protein n=1 Tax=Acidicapsa dinghuensis TaxID=2218256 RepID=A0ABW1EHH4_9BACT|nr:hypothetical protein [Acidicapsa dinghuensis]
MRIEASENDAVGFVAAVNEVIEGLLRNEKPESLIVIKVDNWFGQKWLGFSGLPIPHVAAFYRGSGTRIPPFVPNRVVSQRRFTAPYYEEVDAGSPIHQKIRSRHALRRKASEIAPGTLLVWYSGESEKDKRGSLMAYIPDGNSYRYWYAQWQDVNGWHVVQTDGIKQPDLLKLLSSTDSPVSAQPHRS